MAIPSQAETDFDDPSQRFMWAFRGMEFNGMPIAFPEPVLREWSKHLSACGFVHDPERQEIHYQPAIRGQQHDFNMSGQWVGIDEPIEEPVVSSAEKLTPAEKALLIEEFREEGIID